MELVNVKDCHLMVWETVQSKRNLNNEIKFNIVNSTEVEVGDVIICPQGGGVNSCYELTEIKEVRPSSMPKMNYITAKTKWYQTSLK